MKKLRMSGKSTSLALEYIAEAINSPGRKIKVKDHVGTEQSNKNLLRVVLHICSTLELKTEFYPDENSFSSEYYGYSVDEGGFREKLNKGNYADFPFNYRKLS